MWSLGVPLVNGMQKANIIISDIDKFYKVPKLHSMLSMLTTDFGTLVANNL